MPMDKATKKTAINEIKASIKRMNTNVGVNLSYDKISADIKKIFALNEAERENALKEYELTLRKQTTDDLLTKRSTYWTNATMVERNQKNPVTRASITHVTAGVRKIVAELCKFYDYDYEASNPKTEESIKAIRDWELNELKSRTYYSEPPKYMKEWDKECFLSEKETIEENFKDRKTGTITYVFKNEYNRQTAKLDIVAADVYYKSTVAKSQLASHNFLWKLFNYRYVAACNAYIAKAEEILEAVGFNEAEHGAKALEVLKGTMTTPHDIDEEHVNGAYRSGAAKLKMQNTVQLTVARDQLNLANELDKNPETSIDKKLAPFFQKYNLKSERFHEIVSIVSFDFAASQYDTQRNTGEMKDTANNLFIRVLDDMIAEAIIGGREVNAKEFMEDAAKISEISMEHYLKVSEIEELKDIDRPLYAFGLVKTGVLRRFTVYKDGVNYKDPKSNNEYRKAMPIPGMLEKAAAEAEQIVSQWIENPQMLMKNEVIQEPKAIEENANEILIDENADKKPITSEARKLGNEMFKIGFRPSKEDIQGQIDNMNLITPLLYKNEALTSESKSVFRANQSKLMHFKKALEDGGEALKQINAEFETVDKLLIAKYDKYVPQTVEEIEQGRERISVNLDENVHENIHENKEPQVNEPIKANDVVVK